MIGWSFDFSHKHRINILWIVPWCRITTGGCFHYKASVFSKINPISTYLFHLKSFLWKGPLAIKARKKFINQILSFISFSFEIHAHLAHFFGYPPKIIKFNRWYCLENDPSTKLYLLWKSVLCEKHHKTWSQEWKQKQSLLFNFCNIFDLLISKTEKYHGEPLFLSRIFKNFPIMNNLENLKKFHGQVFIVSYLLELCAIGC